MNPASPPKRCFVTLSPALRKKWREMEKNVKKKAITISELLHYFIPMAALALPIALQSAISFFVNLADNIMIGNLGNIAVSGVYIGTQAFTLLQWFVTGITTSMTILATQYWGKGDTKSICGLTSIGILFGLPVSLILGIVSVLCPSAVLSVFTKDLQVIFEGANYLRILAFSFPFFCISQCFYAVTRSIENTKIGLYISFLVLTINVSCNYILIFGKFGFPAMGCRGAALATVLSRILETLIISFYIFYKDSVLQYRLKNLFDFRMVLIKEFFYYGTPILAGEVVWGFNNLMRTYFIGHFSATVITAFSVINTLSETVFICILAMESAAGILTGKMIGAGKNDEIRPYARHMQIIFLLIGTAAVLFLYGIREPFISLYHISGQARNETFRLSSVMIPIVLFSTYEDMTLCGIVKFGGETAFVLKTDTILVFLIMLPLCLAATHFKVEPSVVYFLLQLDQIIKCIIAFVKVNRFNWAHSLTKSL